jgi:hypothetical protein
MIAVKEINMRKTQLHWEWPDGREPSEKIAIVVSSIDSESTSFLGLAGSPSIGGNYSDPVIIKGSLIVGQGDLQSQHEVYLRAPKIEMSEISIGENVAVGLTDENVAICVATIPTGIDIPAIEAWLESWTCG